MAYKVQIMKVMLISVNLTLKSLTIGAVKVLEKKKKLFAGKGRNISKISKNMLKFFSCFGTLIFTETKNFFGQIHRLDVYFRVRT
jgi:hypothetical protein